MRSRAVRERPSRSVGPTAEVVVAVERTSCAVLAPVDAIGVVVNGAPVAVPIGPRVEVCTLRLVALYVM